MVIYTSTYSEEWHESSFGHAYLVKDRDTVLVLTPNGDWVPSVFPVEKIAEACALGMFKQSVVFPENDKRG